MQNSKYFNIAELVNSFMHANQRVLHNYLKNISGYHHDLRDISSTYSELYTKMFVHPTDMIKIYSLNLDFFKKQQDLWSQLFLDANSGEIKEMIEPNKNDRRFIDSAWSNNQYFSFIIINYL